MPRFYCGLLLLVFAFGAAAQPSATPEVVLHTVTAIETLAAAGDADAQLIAWSEQDGVHWTRAGGGEVFTAPLADPLLSRAIAPTIARSGDMFLVAWIDARAGTAPHLAFHEIHAVRTNLDGRPLDAAPLILGSASSVAGGFGLASRATADRFHVYHALYEWQVLRDGSIPVRARTTLFHPLQSVVSNGRTTVYAGTALQPSGGPFLLPMLFVQAHPAGAAGPALEDLVFVWNLVLAPSAAPAVATNGNGFLLIWAHRGAVMSHAFDPDGKPVDVPNTIMANVSPSGVSVAWDGSNYVVAWDAGDVFGATVNEDNQLTARFNISNSADIGRNPVLLPLGDGQSMVFYVRSKEIVSRIITTRGRARRVR